MSETKLAALDNIIEEFISRIRRRQVVGSLQCATETARILREVITIQRFPDAVSMLEAVQATGTRIQTCKPLELAIGNITRRIMHIIRTQARDESTELSVEVSGEMLEEPRDGDGDRGAHSSTAASPGAQSTAGESEHRVSGSGSSRQFSAAQISQMGQLARALARNVSLHNLLDQPVLEKVPLEKLSEERSGLGKAELEGRKRKGVKWQGHSEVINSVNELLEELSLIEDNIARQAHEHIHANECILTSGCSRTALEFFKEAADKRDNYQFQLVVAETAPSYSGHPLARAMSEAGVQTTVIADAAVFAMMARVNKVIVGAHAVLANGGIIGTAGTHAVALAARQHSVPFVVLVGLHKLSPLFPHDPYVAFNDFQSPEEVLPHEALGQQRFSHLPEGVSSTVDVPNPAYDFVPPNLISLLITDTGGHTPSYVYRLLAEYYSRDDYALSKELLDSLTIRL